jgi:hypothetical protein
MDGVYPTNGGMTGHGSKLNQRIAMARRKNLFFGRRTPSLLNTSGCKHLGPSPNGRQSEPTTVFADCSCVSEG